MALLAIKECMVCLNDEGRVLSGEDLPMKYCDCAVSAHVLCYMRALKAMEGRRFCLICDLEHWEKCWTREQNKAIRRVLFTIMGIYLILYLLIIFL